jgi:two-component sensor histidine kinase
VEIVGPEVRVTSGTAVVLGMAFHELATNAAKHGAFSIPTGRVRLS